MGKKQEFKLTVEEANLLDRIAGATKMDGWFYIDPDLHVHDIEENNVSSDAEGVCLLEDGLAYGLDEPQSGGLNPEEIRIVKACFKRAREAKEPKPKPKATEEPKRCPFPGGGLVEVRVVDVSRLRGGAMDLGYPHDEMSIIQHKWSDGKPSYINPKDIIACYPCLFETEYSAPRLSGWKLILRGHTEPIYCLESPLGRRTGLTVKATVTFQRWEGNTAYFNGEAEFDACDALDTMDDEEIARVERSEPYALDAVYKAAVRLGQIHDYDGPFEVDLDEDNLSDYLEARRNG